jgi:peptidoglycan/xylan/chitin deacetylase (PgdA/CDA1 family)
VVVTFDDGSADNVAHAFPILERQRIPAVTFVVTGKLGGRNDWDGDAAPWALMDGAAIRDWARRGFEFGVHGRTHRSLSGLDDAVAETDGAQADLAVLLGKTPLAFAYPYGDVTARARAGRPAVCDRLWCARRNQPFGRRSLDAAAHGRPAGLSRGRVLCRLRLGWGPRDRARRAAAAAPSHPGE